MPVVAVVQFQNHFYGPNVADSIVQDTDYILSRSEKLKYKDELDEDTIKPYNLFINCNSCKKVGTIIDINITMTSLNDPDVAFWTTTSVTVFEILT